MGRAPTLQGICCDYVNRKREPGGKSGRSADRSGSKVRMRIGGGHDSRSTIPPHVRFLALIRTIRDKISRNGGTGRRVPRRKCLPRGQPVHGIEKLGFLLRHESQRLHPRARERSRPFPLAEKALQRRPCRRLWFQKRFACRNTTPLSVESTI